MARCCYCATFPVGDSYQAKIYKLCGMCASDGEIIKGKERAAEITKEIRAGLPRFYRELRNEANNER